MSIRGIRVIFFAWPSLVIAYRSPAHTVLGVVAQSQRQHLPAVKSVDHLRHTAVAVQLERFVIAQGVVLQHGLIVLSPGPSIDDPQSGRQSLQLAGVCIVAGGVGLLLVAASSSIADAAYLKVKSKTAKSKK